MTTSAQSRFQGRLPLCFQRKRPWERGFTLAVLDSINHWFVFANFATEPCGI